MKLTGQKEKHKGYEIAKPRSRVTKITISCWGEQVRLSRAARELCELCGKGQEGSFQELVTPTPPPPTPVWAFPWGGL